MLKESLILIIFLIIIYQIYLNYTDKQSDNSIDNKEESNKPTDSKQNKNRFNESESNQHKIKSIDDKNKHIQGIREQSLDKQKLANLHPLYGKPDKQSEDGFIFFKNVPKPWSYVIFNNEKIPNHFFVISLIPLLKSTDRTTILNTIGQWLNFMKTNEIDLNFNGQELELFIPSQDEEFALTICNLIINCIKGNLSLKNIVDNNLIQVSVSKIKKYSIIKNKITDQIMANLNESNNENFSNSDIELTEGLEYKEDLAKSEYTNNVNDNMISSNQNNTMNSIESNEPKFEQPNEIKESNNFNTFQNSNDGLNAFEQSGYSNFSFI